MQRVHKVVLFSTCVVRAAGECGNRTSEKKHFVHWFHTKKNPAVYNTYYHQQVCYALRIVKYGTFFLIVAELFFN
jgi:hypothetical protein